MSGRQALILFLGLSLVVANGIASGELRFLWKMLSYIPPTGTSNSHTITLA